MARSLLFLAIVFSNCTTDVLPPKNALKFALTKVTPQAGDSLYPVFPNPFNRTVGDTTLFIRFALKDTGTVTVLVQNALGDAVAQYSDTLPDQGFYAAIWDPLAADGTRLNAGVYFVTLHTSNYVNSRLVNIEQNE